MFACSEGHVEKQHHLSDEDRKLCKRVRIYMLFLDKVSNQFSFAFFCFAIFRSGGNIFQSGRGAQRKARSAAGAAGAGQRGASGILRFYAEDSPGLQLGPTQVLMMSVSFVGIVVLLHIWGKFRS